MVMWTGLTNGVYGINYSLVAGSTGNTRTVFPRYLARKNYGAGEVQALLHALVGGAVGATALKQHKRVQAIADTNGNFQGGKRTVETFTQINRATVTADMTKLLANLVQASQPTTYPADKSGNGGGGKLGR